MNFISFLLILKPFIFFLVLFHWLGLPIQSWIEVIIDSFVSLVIPGNIFNVSSLNMMIWYVLKVFFMSTFCQIKEIYFYSKFTKNIFYEWILNFTKLFFSTNLNDKVIFILYSVNTVNYSDRFMWWIALPDFF